MAEGEHPEPYQRTAAYGVVTSVRGVLLTELSGRTAAPGRWTLPGGGIDPGETPLEGYPENKKKAWIITVILWLASMITAILLTVVSISITAAALEGRNVPVQPPLPPASQSAPAPSSASTTDENSLVVTVSEGNTVKIGVLDSLYTTEIPAMSYLKPANGGFLVFEVSWETLTGTSTAARPA